MLGQPVSMLIPTVVGVQADRRAAQRHHRHRPGADHHRAAAQARRGRQVRGVLRRRRGRRPGGQPGHDRQHVARSTARPAPSSRSTPRPCSYLRLTGRARRAGRAGRGLRQGAGPVARPAPGETRLLRATLELDLSTVVPSHRRARSARRTGSRWPTPSAASATRCRPRAGDQRWTSRRPVESFPASDPSRETATGRRPARAETRSAGATRSRYGSRRTYARPRGGGDRRDHLLHQHLQPVGDGRRRACWPATRSRPA